MPGLVSHYVVKHVRLAYVVVIDYPLGKLGVPPLVKQLDVPLAYNVEVILVLRYNKVVYAEELYKFVEQSCLAPGVAIYKHHTRVEEYASVYSDDLFCISSVHIHLRHSLLDTRTDIKAVYIGVVKLADVTGHNSVGVDVYCLIVLGKHIRYKKAEIGGLCIVVPDRELVLYLFKITAHVFKCYLEAVVCKAECFFHHSLGYVGVKHVDAVFSRRICILYH